MEPTITMKVRDNPRENEQVLEKIGSQSTRQNSVESIRNNGVANGPLPNQAITRMLIKRKSYLPIEFMIMRLCPSLQPKDYLSTKINNQNDHKNN